MYNSFLQLKRKPNLLTELLNSGYIQQTLIRNAYWCWVVRETSCVCLRACVRACLNKILLFLFSSVQDVSKRKEYTVPLPSNADNEALCTEQRQLMGKLENKCRKRLRITVMIYFFCWKVNMKSKATLFDFLRKDKGIYCMDAIRGKILKFKYLNIKCFFMYKIFFF